MENGKKSICETISPFSPASHPAKTFNPLDSCVISQNKFHVVAVKKKKKKEKLYPKYEELLGYHFITVCALLAMLSRYEHRINE